MNFNIVTDYPLWFVVFCIMTAALYSVFLYRKDTKFNKGRIGGWYGRDSKDRNYPTMPNAGLACVLGMTLAKFESFFGDGHTKAVQVGGSSGFCVPRKDFENTIQLVKKRISEIGYYLQPKKSNK